MVINCFFVKEKRRETYIPASSAEKSEKTRVHGANGKSQWPQCNKEKKGQRPEKVIGLTDGDRRSVFSRSSRILKSREFALILKKGRRTRGVRLEYVFMRNGLERSRLGLIVSRKTGNAVARNRHKRIVREVFRLNNHKFTENIDLLVRSAPFKGDLKFMNVQSEFTRLTARLAQLSA